MNPVELVSWTYPGAFTHNAWPDDSGDFLYVTDEVNGQPLKIFDITGSRDRAVNEYRQAARTRDNTQGALEEAEKYIAAPYERERPRF